MKSLRSLVRAAPARALSILLPVLAPLAATGCWRQQMADQPAPRPMTASPVFADGRASRPLPEGTIPRGELREDRWLYEGRDGAGFAKAFPFAITEQTLERGRERYDIFCAPCHDRTGAGEGMVVQRGYPKPPSMHLLRLRESPPGALYDVIARGFGRMPSHAPQIPVSDRWAIVAYIRALQRSQTGKITDVPDAMRPGLKRQQAPGTSTGGAR